MKICVYKKEKLLEMNRNFNRNKYFPFEVLASSSTFSFLKEEFKNKIKHRILEKFPITFLRKTSCEGN